MRVDGTAARAETAPPALGQHTREVLEELGAPPAEVDRLAAEGAVVIS
jgi:crotonobetainyl-CoA:carnitine CoA-transferase CaiB-like acyl-CoA transferase